MGFWANILEAIRNLMATKQRTVLALIGIVIGTGSVIAMVSIGKIIENESLRQFLEMGIDKVTISLQNDEGSGFSLKDAATFATTFPEIIKSAPMIHGNSSINLGGKQKYFSTLGVTEAFQPLNKLRLKEGRFISQFDHYRRFCVVGHEIAQFFAMAGDPLQINDEIQMGSLRYTVIGLLHPFPRDFSSDFNNTVIMPISTISRSVPDSSISGIVTQVRSGTDQTRLSDRINQWMEKHYRDILVDIQSPEQIIAQMETQMQLYTLMLGAIGSISLIVGGVGVMNIMLVSVSERRKEIGIRMALGARRQDVQNQFLVEALFLALFGGLLGVGLGVGTAWGVAWLSELGFIMNYSAMIIGFGVSALVGVFFGFYPAMQASKLDPIKALRAS